nr:MAG TPA: hypothetical protein [Caudoviricetes sp.]
MRLSCETLAVILPYLANKKTTGSIATGGRLGFWSL